VRVLRFMTLALSVLVCVSALATTVKPMSIQELSDASSNVVHARAIESRSAWNPQRTLIYTYTRFQLIETLKGDSASEFIVRQLGGSAEGYTQKVAGVRPFARGQEVVLFLRPSESGGVFAVTGLFQGNFNISRSAGGEGVVSNGVAGVSALQRGSVKTYHGEQMTYRQLRQTVQSSEGAR
jgi:hypothetical protein